ncbi:MAG: GGDEF domain-containing protein [Ruminiclostridium sp.]|nr:GGDEF domain-containing protein [Ruminiclostridium sp.]
MIHTDTFKKIAEALLTDYSIVYYVDAVTGEYRRYSVDPRVNSMRLGLEGADFFGDMIRFADNVVYEEDREAFKNKQNKEAVLHAVSMNVLPRFEYRVMIDGKPVWHTARIIRGINPDENDYFVYGIINIDKEVRERFEIEKMKKERELYNRIAEGLASNYDVIYYVNMADKSYVGYTTNNIYGTFHVEDEGDDFFASAPKNASQIVHPNDYEKFVTTLDRDNIITQLSRKRKIGLDYRMIVDGEMKYTRFTVMWAGNKRHVVICVENIDSEIRREKEYLKALNSEKELARRDDLTGAKNKTAYLELIHSVQDNIDNGINYLTFAIVVCDINGLKQINDTEGHQVGDEYIKTCAKLICDVFTHSPVFRIGGDEFVVFIRGGDYAIKGNLFDKLRHEVLKNRYIPGMPIIASGMSAYDPSVDKSVSEVFDRADAMMYENKKELKRGDTPR